MPECHKCPLNGTGSAECLMCMGPAESNHKGRSHISMDAGMGAQTLGEVKAAMGVWRGTGEVRAGLPPVSADAVKVATMMLELDEAEFRLVRGLLRDGKSMAAIAREEGLARATVSARVKKLVERHPVFSFLRQRG